MADHQTNRLKAHEVCWSIDESDIETTLVHVPGIKDSGNRRPARSINVRGRKTKEIKPVIPVSKRPVSETIRVPVLPKSRHNNNQDQLNERKKGLAAEPQDNGNTRPNKASLKELCPEDKQRVANLINELARVGEEKDRFSQELTVERTNYETRTKELGNQHDKIVKEREGVLQQLLDCQRLLARYQNLVSHQQDALNSSFNEDQDPEHKIVGQGAHHRDGHESKDLPSVVPALHLASDNSSNRPPSPVCNDIKPDADNELTTCGSRRRRFPSSVQDIRPFTTFIDSLIASEQSSTKSSQNGHHSAQMSDQLSKRTGPARESTLSSTRQSESLSVSHQSRTKGGDFRPLQPDPSPRSSLQSPGFVHPLDAMNNAHQYPNLPTQIVPNHPVPSYYSHNDQPSQYSVIDDIQRQPHISFYSQEGGSVRAGNQGEEPRVTFSENLHLPSPQGTHEPARFPQDNEFITQYQSMTSEERQNHLMTQKAALLAEQQRLRLILEEQEHLLTTKQDQLMLQQHVQQTRLDHFEKTGYFPPEPVNMEFPKHMLDPLNNVESQESLRQIPPSKAVSDEFGLVFERNVHNQHMDPNARENTFESYESNVPYSHQPVPYPMPKASTQARAHTNVPNEASDGHIRAFDPYYNNPLEISKEEIDAVTDSMENLWYLQRHGVDVPKFKKPPPRRAHLSRRSIGSSPHRPGGLPPAQTCKVHTLEELINEESSDGSSDRIDLPHNPSQRRPPTQTAFKGKIRDHAAHLLDLVDEVESTHTPSRHLTRTTPRRHNENAHYDERHHDVEVNEEEGEEEEEESRILEEVFFVR